MSGKCFEVKYQELFHRCQHLARYYWNFLFFKDRFTKIGIYTAKRLNNYSRYHSEGYSIEQMDWLCILKMYYVIIQIHSNAGIQQNKYSFEL